jgi:hypothetical protein
LSVAPVTPSFKGLLVGALMLLVAAAFVLSVANWQEQHAAQNQNRETYTPPSEPPRP